MLKLTLAIWIKFLADDILKYFSQETGFDISCKLSPNFVKCQMLFSGKDKKNIINLPSTELTQRVVRVNIQGTFIILVICSLLALLQFCGLQLIFLKYLNYVALTCLCLISLK